MRQYTRNLRRRRSAFCGPTNCGGLYDLRTHNHAFCGPAFCGGRLALCSADSPQIATRETRARNLRRRHLLNISRVTASRSLLATRLPAIVRSPTNALTRSITLPNRSETGRINLAQAKNPQGQDSVVTYSVRMRKGQHENAFRHLSELYNSE